MPWQQECTNRNEQQNENRESNSGNCLRDSKGGTKSNEFECNKIPSRLLTPHLEKSFPGGHDMMVTAEVKNLHGNAVTLESLHPHNEEKASQYRLRNELQDGQERSGHGAQC